MTVKVSRSLIVVGTVGLQNHCIFGTADRPEQNYKLTILNQRKFKAYIGYAFDSKL